MKELADFRPLVSEEIKSSLNVPRSPLFGLDQIYLYHLGFSDSKGNIIQDAKGKYLRPTICMAINAGLGGAPERLVSAAASLELIHRTSLIFDDIQDKGRERNGQPAAWMVWGANQAINAGLALSCIARLTAQRMEMQGFNDRNILAVLRILENAVIELTRGQYSDISFQERMNVTFVEYEEMVDQKTGALFGAACEIGALCSPGKKYWPGTDITIQRSAKYLGITLGRIFQMQDDYLGIWGDEKTIGKTANDLAEGKRSMPIVLALSRYPEKMGPWLSALKVVPEDTGAMRDWLESKGIKQETQDILYGEANRAQDLLEELELSDPWTDQIHQLISFVTSRAL